MVEEPETNGTRVYQIKIRGILDERWSDWFSGMRITSVEGITILTGVLVDQAALHGVLERIRDLNLELISVTPMPEEGEEAHPKRSDREPGSLPVSHIPLRKTDR